FERDDVGPKLRETAADHDPVALGEPFARDRTGGDPNRRFARRLPPAAAVIADAVLLPIGVIGVAGTERVRDIRVILATRILIADQQRNRRASRLPFEDAGQYLDRIGLAPLAHMP